MKFIKRILSVSLTIIGFACNSGNQNIPQHDQKEIKNQELANYSFLSGMYQDSYFPTYLVDKGKNILINLCLEIEKTNPKTLTELYKLTHNATRQFNALAYEFDANGSEIETVAREVIALDIEFIARSYNFPHADVEELIAPRDW